MTRRRHQYERGECRPVVLIPVSCLEDNCRAFCIQVFVTLEGMSFIYGMFSKAFSFEGRIRRSEYGVSMIVFVIALVAILFFAGQVENERVGSFSKTYLLPVVLPLISSVLFFIFAQGAKRCHDLGNNGWYQFLPFYGLFMLFHDSLPGKNKYGNNPKGIGNDTEFSFESDAAAGPQQP